MESFNFKLYSLLQPLLLVVSTRLAPHSEELVLGMETFLTIKNKKETTEREKKNYTEGKMLSGKRQINRMIFPLEKVSWIFSNYFLISSLLLRIMFEGEEQRSEGSTAFGTTWLPS